MWDRDSLKNTHCSFPPTAQIPFLQAFLAVVFYCLDNLQSLWLSGPCLEVLTIPQTGRAVQWRLSVWQSLSSEILLGDCCCTFFLLCCFSQVLWLLFHRLGPWVFHFLMASVLKHNLHSSKKVPGFSKDNYPESKSPSRDSFWDLDPDLPFLW